jgi:hypothetical protein
MQSSDDEQQYGTSPVSVKGSPKSVATDVGEFVLPRVPINYHVPSPTSSDDEYSNLLLNQRLEDVSLESENPETKTRKERISIDSEESVKSESSEDIDFPVHIEQKERLEAVNVVIQPSIILDAESSALVTTQIVGDMSISNAALGRQLELTEIKARQDALAIRELREQCRALTTQLNVIQQQRQSEVREAARLEQERLASEAMQKALQLQVERTGY